MTSPHKRTITIKLSRQQKEDGKEAIAAVRVSLRMINVQLQVLEHAEPDAEPSIRRQAQEQLEAKALEAAAALLDQKAREIRGRAAKEEVDKPERVAPSPTAVAKAWKSLREFLGGKAKDAWQVTVVAGLEWVKGQFK